MFHEKENLTTISILRFSSFSLFKNSSKLTKVLTAKATFSDQTIKLFK